MIALSKIGLGLLFIALGEGETGQSLSPAKKEVVLKILHSYDRAWLSGKVEKLSNLLTQDSPCRAKLQEEAALFFESNRMVSSRSSLIRAIESQGNYGAYVEIEFSYVPKDLDPKTPKFRRSLQVPYFFLLHPEGNELRIARIEEIDPKLNACFQSKTLECPACNYRISPPKGWFVLPRRKGWNPCTDSFSFLHPSGKITADLNITEALFPVNATKILETDNLHLARYCGSSAKNIHCTSRKSLDLGKDLRGEEVEGTVVRKDNKGGRAIQFLRTYISKGPILYTLNIYGEEDWFRKHRSEIQLLRDSFEIVNPSLPLATLQRRMKARHNPGGSLEKNLYSNQRYSIRLQGPHGWKAEDLSGPTLLHVRFISPRDPELQLTFHAIEDRNGWPDEDSISQTIAARKRRITHELGIPVVETLQFRRGIHPGLQTFCYEVDWLWEAAEKATRERIGYFPAGSILYILEYRAPARLFKKNLPLYLSALDSLSRF